MSVRASIVSAIATALADIKSGDTVTAGGVSHTYGSTPLSIDAWRKTPYSTAQLPAIAYWDTDQTVDESGIIGKANWRLTIVVVGWVKSSTTAAQTRTLMDDICAAMGADPTLGGYAITCSCQQARMMLDDSTADIVAGCELTFEVLYRAPLFTL